MSSSAFPSNGVPSPTAREYPFPSGLPRGKEAGNVAVSGAFLWVCVSVCVCGVYLLISHQWGKLQHLFLFLLAHDTQLVFFGTDTPQILAAEFFGSTLGGYAMASVISTWATPHLKNQKTDYCIPKQSLWKCTHTGWLKELSRSAHGLRATLKTKRKLQKKKVGCWGNLMIKKCKTCVTILGVDWNLYI